MAKEYAKGFYDSRAWKKTQAAFMASRNYICERCGGAASIVHHKRHIDPDNIHDASITLCWDNLEALCQTCHNQEHIGTASCMPGLYFDQNGNLKMKN